MKFITLEHAVAYYAEATPNNICLIDADRNRQMTYSELWRATRVFARRLQLQGVQKGDRVVVRVGQLFETIVAQFGVYLLGGVYCPLEKNMNEPKLLEMLKYLDSSFLVSTDSIDSNCMWVDLSVALDDGEPIDNYSMPNSETVCAIVFTTGTTGKAKGVILSHRTNIVSSEIRQTAYDYGFDDAFCWTTPLNLVGGIRSFGISFITGNTAVYSSGVIFIDDFLKMLIKHTITVAYLPAVSLGLLLEGNLESFHVLAKQMRALCFGTDSTSLNHRKQIVELLPKTRLLTLYGATETGLMACFDFSRCPEKSYCVGKPLSNIRFSFEDETGKPVNNTSIGNLGRIICENNDMMMTGYWKDPELTGKTMGDNRIKMADVGYTDENGYLYVLGRHDDVIISGGYKIAASEIEEAVVQIPGVLETACISIPHEVLHNIPVLFVVMKDGFEFSVREIHECLDMKLEISKSMFLIRELECLPRVGGNQKIDRKRLIEYV